MAWIKTLPYPSAISRKAEASNTRTFRFFIGLNLERLI